MKKLLKTAACLGLGLFSLTTVSAKEMNLTDGSVLENNNVYIVGNWVFQLNKYGIKNINIEDDIILDMVLMVKILQKQQVNML